jgi:hypothetical protein
MYLKISEVRVRFEKTAIKHGSVNKDKYGKYESEIVARMWSGYFSAAIDLGVIDPAVFCTKP